MFDGALAFNQPLSSWDTSSVETMFFTFFDASAFNQPVGAWDTSNVKSMSSMFSYAVVFNEPIDAWNTSSVTEMGFMFHGAHSFDQPIGSWDTSRVTEMSGMFEDAIVFNQPLRAWNTSSVRDMTMMFKGARAFAQSIGNWDMSAARYETDMFDGAVSFDQPPCRHGAAPAPNGLGCLDCEEFPPSSAPDACMVCSFPLLGLEDGCIWWHLPLVAIAFVSLAVLLSMLACRVVERRRKILDTAERQLYEDMWSDPAHAGKRYKALRQRLGLPNSNIDKKLAGVLCLQSHRAGVGMSLPPLPRFC